MKENKLKNIIQKYNTYFYYTVIFTILAIFVFSIFINTGKSFIWYIDGFKQHYVILYDFNTTIKNIFKEGVSLFSWNMGLGLDVIGQYSYYILGDPFAYISLLFPIEYLEYVYQILIILRIYCVGIAFIMYCRYNGKENYNTLIGAIIYTFTGYMFFASIRHPYFTNPIIMLPLIFIGIDKILKEDKYLWFMITTAILAIMNYYFLYMITILAIIYAIVKYITEYNKGSKIFGQKLLKTMGYYIIAIMIAGIILLPTIYAFLNSDRGGTPYTYYDQNYYSKLLFSQLDNEFWSKTNVAILGLLMLPIGILNFKNNKENRTVLINIAIYILILIVPFLGSVMNGFSFQSNRWCFAYTFFMAYLVVINLKKNLKYTKKEFISVAIFVAIYILLALIVKRIDKQFVFASIIFMNIIIVILDIRKSILNTKKICQALILTAVCINIIFVSNKLYSQKNYNYANEFYEVAYVDEIYDTYEGKIKKFKDAINYIKDSDDSFYRIGTPIYGDFNHSIMYDYNGLNTYLSIGNGYISNLSKELLILGNSCNPRTNALNELDSRTKITTLLGSKYYIASKSDSSNIPYGYELIEDLGPTAIYQNKNFLPIGVFYNDYILYDDYEKLNALEKEQVLLDTAVLKDNSKVKEFQINYDKELLENIKNTSSIVNFTVSPEDKYINSKEFCINFDEVQNCELYLYFDNLEYHAANTYYVIAKYNGTEKAQKVYNKVTSAYYFETPYILFNLGYAENHSGKIEITLTGEGDYTCDDIKIFAVPMEKYDQSIKNLKETHFEVQKVENNYIKGTINNTESGILQISTSYTKGWKAYVDGKQVETINVNTGFIGIPIEAGEHEIYLTYFTPWLKFGILISCLGIAILIVLKLHKKNA